MWHHDNIDNLPQGRWYDSQLAKRLLPILAPFRRRIVAAGLVLLASSGLGLLPPLLMRRAIDLNIARRDFPGLLATVGLYILVQAAVFGVNYLMAVALEGLGVRLVSALKERLFGKMLELDISFFDQQPVGQLLARVESDTESIRRLFTTTMFTLLGALVSLAGMVAVMLSVSSKLFLAVSVLLPPIVALTVLFQRTVRPMFIQARRKYAEITGYLTEMIQGMRLVQAFSREAVVAEGLSKLNGAYLKTVLPAEILDMGFFSMIGLFEIIGLAIILLFGSRMVVSGTLTIGSLVLFLGYLRQFFMPVYAFSEQVGVMQRAFAAAERVFQILDIKPKISSRPGAFGRIAFRRQIEFRKVSFAYEPSDGPENWVLQDISFVVNQGERVALVGATGSGKTSIINLLLRFYDPQQGSILMDGRDIRDLDVSEWRSHFGLVLQDIYLFSGSLRENLTLGADLPEERLRRAMETLGLKGLLKRLPGGLDAELAERGANLSLGQRQLLSFARALAQDPEILILDEATSSVDPHTERLVQEGIRRLLAGRTAIIIAHRLSTIMDADRILVVHKGRIAEQGRHRELLDRGGIYSRLYKIQLSNI